MTIARIVTDLSFGDAGKGTTVDYLARQMPTAVIRHNGGPQAAHNVVTPDGRHHTFSQFGSGSFAPGVVTHLSEDMLVNPLVMLDEAEQLTAVGVDDIWHRLTVDRRARIITPWHRAVNQLREQSRGAASHGTCAHGVGELMADDLEFPGLTLYAGELMSIQLEAQLERIRQHKLTQARETLGHVVSTDAWQLLEEPATVSLFAQLYREWMTRVRVVAPDYLVALADRYDQLVFEGAQGVLLDEWYGFHPYTTWSTTTPENARRQLADIGFADPIETLGVIRAYTTRHGPGPFVTEDASLAASLREYHNVTNIGQGAFRYGHFDAVTHRYAIAVTHGIDQLVVTGLDRAESLTAWQYCDRYDFMGDDQRFFSADGRAILPGTKGDLIYQERLGQALTRVRPVLTPRPMASAKEMTAVIEQMLGTPVGITSHGPTADDKLVWVAVS